MHSASHKVHKALIGQQLVPHEADWLGVGVCGCQRILPTAVQTQTQKSIPERPPLPPEGLNTGEVLGQREWGGRGGGVIVAPGLGVRPPGGLPSRV